MQSKTSLLEGKVFPTLLKFALPFLAASLLQALYGSVDLLIVGQFCDTASVSAVSTGSHILMVITNITVGLTTGGTVLIGNAVGAKRSKDAADATGAIICCFTVIAVVLTAVMVAFARPISILMNAPEEALEYTVDYVLVASCGIIFIVGYNMLSGIMRGLGDSKTPLIFVAIACVMNIVLDLVFVGPLNMGPKGAALATIMAQAVSMFMAILIIKKRKFPYEFHKSNIRFHRGLSGRVFRYGAPLAVTNVMTDISFLIIMIFINEMGVVASAALGIVEKLIGYMLLPPIAFLAADSAMVAQNMGAGFVKRSKQVLKYSIIFCFCIGVIFTVVCNLTPDTFTSIFSRDADVITNASKYLSTFCLDCVLVAFMFNFNGYFTGCGRSMFTMIHGLLGAFLVRIPITYLVSLTYNGANLGDTMFKMGFAAPTATVFQIILCVIYFVVTDRKDRQKMLEAEALKAQKV